jgi:hypothetical protein
MLTRRNRGIGIRVPAVGKEPRSVPDPTAPRAAAPDRYLGPGAARCATP